MNDDVQEYLNRIAREPLLSPQEEITLGRQVQAAQEILALQSQELTRAQKRIVRIGEKAKQRMIAANLRLCFSIAKNLTNKRQSLSILDLVQEGAIGLNRAAERFDPTRGYKFSTFAHWWIRQSITRAIAEKDRLIRMPCNAGQQVNRFKKAVTAAMKTGKPIDARQMAKDLGVNYWYVEVALQTNVVSLDFIVNHKGEESTPLIDLIPDNRYEEQEDDSSFDMLRSCIEKLGHYDRQVVELLFLKGMSHHEVSKKIGCSSGKISQTAQSAIVKLRMLMNRQVILEQQSLAI